MEAQLSCGSCSFTSDLVTLRFDKRASLAGFLLSVLGLPTCLTAEAGMADEPLFGGTGGFDEECRR